MSLLSRHVYATPTAIPTLLRIGTCRYGPLVMLSSATGLLTSLLVSQKALNFCQYNHIRLRPLDRRKKHQSTSETNHSEFIKRPFLVERDARPCHANIGSNPTCYGRAVQKFTIHWVGVSSYEGASSKPHTRIQSIQPITKLLRFRHRRRFARGSIRRFDSHRGRSERLCASS